MRRTRLGMIAIAAFAVGCGGLRVAMVDSAYQRPSNVAVYFTVDSANGDPVGGLQATDFRIYEDGQLVSPTESQQTIVNPEVAAEHYTLLLVDMSGSVTESDQVPLIQQAATEFTSQLEGNQRVAVYAFDGSEEIFPIAGFTTGGAAGGISRLGSFRTRDPSTNLHGAVVAAIGVLDAELARSQVPLRFGTVVVFTDGSDRAARVTRNDMGRAIDDSPYDVFAIGVGSEIDEGTLGAVGRDGYVLVEDTDAVTAAFQRIGERILAMTRRFYLLSYCSPARAGTHRVTVEAVTPEATGNLSYDFDATGFGPQCRSESPPPFAVGNARTTRTRPRAARGSRIQVRATAQ
ncbi:MAG: VWA domain-containing protein [Myxococcota bacterium]|nr:VWA domain-containing protein [Myxococcota bacterium]